MCPDCGTVVCCLQDQSIVGEQESLVMRSVSCPYPDPHGLAHHFFREASLIMVPQPSGPYSHPPHPAWWDSSVCLESAVQARLLFLSDPPISL